MSYKIKFKDVQDSMTLYGMMLTKADVLDVFESDPQLLKDLEQVGEWETCCREAFANAVGKWLGLRGDWPKGGDTDSYAEAYFQSFELAAFRVGLRLSKDFTGDKR